jgi:hypothetical protein
MDDIFASTSMVVVGASLPSQEDDAELVSTTVLAMDVKASTQPPVAVARWVLTDSKILQNKPHQLR